MQLSLDLIDQQDESQPVSGERPHSDATPYAVNGSPGTWSALEEITRAVLEGVRHVLDATACSVWLVERATGYLVCKHSTDPADSAIHGWRLAPGHGIASWVVAHKRGIIVPDTRDDSRHARIVSEVTGTECRSVLAVPMLTKGCAVGVIEVVDHEPGRFRIADLCLVESLATTAAVAIEHAQLYDARCRAEVGRERHRLARNLHDTVLQALYSIELATRASLALLERQQVNAAIFRPLQHILSLTQETLADVNRSLCDLEAQSWAHREIAAALAEHCAMLQKQYDLNVRLVVASGSALTPEQKDVLYNVTKEALWNVVRHARATNVEVHLTSEADKIVLCIADNGVGMLRGAPSTVPARGIRNRGIRNMEERVHCLGGALCVESAPGEGTRVTVRLPIGQDRHGIAPE